MTPSINGRFLKYLSNSLRTQHSIADFLFECGTVDQRDSQSIRNQESAVRPDHRGSDRKDLVQGDLSRRGLEQNERRSARGRDEISHLEEYQEYMLRGTETSR